ncbi:MAG: aminotransferase class I/II-fold pyridoxal phosphate-dependent enzyme [Oscillospiraceae bacterium]|nr:aminotransferase class I/II-fold pyridoxal phosphate-dependent enzyme [Oscillospiraceae bacterium]MBQ3501206.1 aminotransferase class I/II-fold pyridoxal phosphate-dependent enzyme [Oscillospiraceae bacterium]MBQ4642656.1 aminotransferase class I/II-fold pyridoxal phosphate-dependent enzyme [Oscillospiraceae bacterium]
MDYSKILSEKVAELKPSGIRKFFDLAAEVEDVIALTIGEPDFKTPWHIREAGIDSLKKGHTWYTANAGLIELRQEASKYLKRRFNLDYDAKDIFITVGGSEAIDLTIRAIIDSGDEMLLPIPSFVCYDPICRLAGGKVVTIETKRENDFRLTAEELRAAITPKTKLLVLPFPNNPTGAVMRREHLEEIAEVLRGTDIMVLSDEIYAELTYGGERHVSIAEIEGMKERTILVNGFSKAYAMTGWRLGYVAGPSPIISQMLKIHQYGIMSSPTTSQYAAVVAMRDCDDEVEKMKKEYDMRRRYLVKAFNDMGLDCFTPEGAFYVFPCIKSTGLSSEEFCEKLLHSKKVAVVPGGAFGSSGEGFVRVSYSYSLDHIMEAAKRIKEFLEELENEQHKP